MGIIKRGILGGFSNKVANVVGSSWKGIAYMRAMPLSVANPRTAGQVTQRTKFGTISSFASNFVGSWIQPLWNRFAVQASGFNDFVQRNIVYVSSGGVINYAGLQMSRGKLDGVDDLGLTGGGVTADDFIDVSWAFTEGTGNQLPTDDIYVMGYNATQDEWSDVAVEIRNNTSTTITFDTVFAGGDVVHVFVAARRADGTMVSNSQYETLTVL